MTSRFFRREAAIPCNPVRGEAALCLNGVEFRVRPSFGALVAAEEELGPLFGLIERAASGALRLEEMSALLWHCLEPRPDLGREAFSDALVAGGLAAATPALKVLLGQILAGR